jgi:hypothetical protein
MAIRQVILQNEGGTLTLIPPEVAAAGDTPPAIADAKASLYSPAGTALLTNQDADVGEDGSLSFDVPAEQTADLGAGYRIRWKYTVDGVAAVPKDRVFDVVTHVLDQPLCAIGELFEHYPMLRGREPDEPGDQAMLLAKAWELTLNRIRTLGQDPGAIIDGQPLEPAQAAIAAHLVAVNYGAGRSDDDWVDWGEARLADADRLLPSCLAACTFWQS